MVWAARSIGRESLALLPEIGEGLDDEDAWVRYNAAQALEIWGEGAEREQLRLVHALDDSETFVRFNALGALKNMRLPAGRWTELLQKVNAQDAAQAQCRASDVLRRLGHQRLSY